jgi:hypothetical protein
MVLEEEGGTDMLVVEFGKREGPAKKGKIDDDKDDDSDDAEVKDSRPTNSTNESR